MFIDISGVPFQPLLIHRNNNYTRCTDEVIEEIPIQYPPKYFQYIDGPQYFLIRRRDDGYLAAAFDHQRVRESITSDPDGWESACLGINLEIDRSMAMASGNNRFWLLYLPFLSYFEYRHQRTYHGTTAWYELRNERGELLFDCDAQQCIDLWSNVRTDQWFYDNQRRVAKFIRCIQQPDGWINEWPYNVRQQQPLQSPQPPQPIAGTPPPQYQPPSPTFNTNMGGHTDTDNQRRNVEPRTGGSADDAISVYSDDSRADSAYGSGMGNTRLDRGYTSSISDDFSDIISDILDNEYEYRITYPGQQPMDEDDPFFHEYDESTRWRWEFQPEYRRSEFRRTDLPGNRSSTPDGSIDDDVRSQPPSEPDDNNSINNGNDAERRGTTMPTDRILLWQQGIPESDTDE